MRQVTNAEARALIGMLPLIRKQELTRREENQLRMGIAAIKHLKRRIG